MLFRSAAVIGNSSSGILEVPSFGIPTLNIGDRQKGRISAESVIHCGTSKRAISDGIETVLSSKIQKLAKQVVNPYEKENTTLNILNVIRDYPLTTMIQKTFYYIEA